VPGAHGTGAERGPHEAERRAEQLRHVSERRDDGTRVVAGEPALRRQRRGRGVEQVEAWHARILASSQRARSENVESFAIVST
jgi:hypothetical protein